MPNKVKKQIYVGVFLVALATLMYEILITRIFSVTMWYHFAFLAISIALLGMTVGALAVYSFPNYFTKKRVNYHLAISSLLFAVAIIVVLLIQLNFSFSFQDPTQNTHLLVLTLMVSSVPFIFSGLCISLALTKFSRQVSKLYAVDLIGASLGCILVIYILNITDAPSAVTLTAFLASIASVFFAISQAKSGVLKLAVFSSIIFLLLASSSIYLATNQRALFRIKSAKGFLQKPPLFEKWNSYSRVTVRKNIGRLEGCCPGISPVHSSKNKVERMHMTIDASAYSPLIAFDGDTSAVEYLKYHIANLVHYLRKDAKVLIVGSGGGSDVLSALVFSQDSIVAVEINNEIIKAVNEVFGDFTGHLDRYPNITFVNDEARSYIANQKNNFDIIQISLIDTWAATTAGAFVLTENSLYTTQAWEKFFEKLNPDGVLSVTRWYFEDKPAEIYRLTSLASTSLKQIGVKVPKDHIIIVKRLWVDGQTPDDTPSGLGVATLLVSKNPFSAKDIKTIEEISREMEFEVVMTPRFSPDPVFVEIASGHEIDKLAGRLQINIEAPTDNSPFFFNMLRIRDIFNSRLWMQGMNSYNMQAVNILGFSLISVVVLTVLFIFTPLMLKAENIATRETLPLLIFFASIGLGFMTIEISQMQRLIVLLGHPTLSLSVVLFTLLLSSGIGSFSTQSIKSPADIKILTPKRILLLLATLAIFGLLTPQALGLFEGSTRITRIMISVAILFPLGFFMGMAFPLGMKLASQKKKSLTPWLWGVNGATSVLASVLAVAIALSLGISISYWSGFGFYVIAYGAFLRASSE